MIDLAVLRVDGLTAPVLPWSEQTPVRDSGGAVLGFPGGQRELAVSGAVVRSRNRAVGRDIYGTGNVERHVLTLAADIRRGDSGGPFVTADGAIGGIVFAASAGERDTGYALEADWIRDDVEAAGDTAVATGACRF
jgi:S1-C subfamily serine protease